VPNSENKLAQIVGRPEGEGEIATMSGLRRYIEWMSRGRRTDRIAYVMKEWDLPVPLPGDEWQLDASFNAGDEILRDPDCDRIQGGA
jgi:hypothetical protein